MKTFLTLLLGLIISSVSWGSDDETVECALQDLSQPGEGLQLSGPILWRGFVVPNRQAVTINSKLKTAKPVSAKMRASSKDEMILPVYSFGFGDIFIEHKQMVAMGKERVSMIDTKSELGLTCAFELPK